MWLGCCYGAWLLLRVFLALALKIRCRGLNLSDLCVFSANNESFVVKTHYTNEEGVCIEVIITITHRNSSIIAHGSYYNLWRE